jgi:hypothetical protein
MALRARQQRALSCIADNLAASDPKLASRFAFFNQLTRGEKMPADQQGRSSRQREASPRRRRRERTLKRRRPGRVVNAPLLLVTASILISAALITMAIVLSNVGHGPDRHLPCPQSWWASTCARQ